MIALNDQQKKAVEALNIPVFILAGAGTGKTRVLIERIAKFINVDGIDHRRILAITFTNKARDEIRERVAAKLGIGKIPPHIYTFHAFFYQLLRKDAEKLDPNFRNFRLLDENDQRAIVRRLLKGRSIFNLDGDPIDPATAVSAISIWKINVDGLKNSQLIKKIVHEFNLNEVDLRDLYQEYQDELRNNCFFDYDDLEVYACKVLDDPEVRAFWQQEFKAVLIDEFQDTSFIQMEIVKKMVSKDSANIFCVGDPDQSIYGFRGAKPMVCSEFIDHFGATCIKLEQNYRSTKHILETSNYLINLNRTDGLYKTLKSARNEFAKKVQCYSFNSDWDEVDWVLSEIDRIRALDKKSTLRDFVILYRNNVNAKPFEIALKKKNLEYVVANTVEFFSRLEIKYIVSFLRLLYFHDEKGFGIAIGAICDARKDMGIGEMTCSKFCSFVEKNNYGFLEGVENLDNCPSLSAKARKGFRKLADWLRSLLDVRDDNIKNVINEIVFRTEYDVLVEAKQEEGRLENIMQFAESISYKSENKSNKDLVAEISLRAREAKKPKSNNFLQLSTVHQAKGLEYKYVFLVKMTEHVFPTHYAKTTWDNLEERRIAYVAFTRAKDGLYITSSPYKSKNIIYSNESIFLKNIKNLKEHVNYIDRRKKFFVENKFWIKYW